MKTLLLSIAIIIASPSWCDSQSIQEIPDEANLPLLSPDLSERTTAKIRLANGLEVYLISDPLADQSAAAMAVQVGSWNDPVEFPGMAHFCEHMLFKGSQKFSNENEFYSLITDNNGQTNAFTGSDRTVYMFSSCEEGFLPILEHFARFFIDPLFLPSGISKEMHAVDQEFSKNIENDFWRTHMVFKETGNPDHPNAMFDCGNSETLSHIPQSALKKWHADHYTAQKMRLVVYSHLSIDTLKETIKNYFSAIPNHPFPIVDSSASLTSSQQKGHFIYIQPLKKTNRLSLCWELPKDISLDRSKSAELFAYALSRGQPFSLHEQLKKEGLIDDLSIDVSQLGDLSHQILSIDVDLTLMGLKQTDDVILRIFQGIASLKKSGIPDYLYHEMNDTAKLSYQFQPREKAFYFVMNLGSNILDEALSTFPSQKIIASKYAPDQIARVESFLTPENCIFFLEADFSNTNISLDHSERWIGANYTIKDIPLEKLKNWKNAKPHSNIRLANPNPFISTNFQLVSQNDDPKTLAPLLLNEDDSGIVYYSRIVEFPTPKSVFHLHILTPEINASAKSRCLTSLYLNYLNDRLHPTLSAAASAGIKCNFSIERNQLNCIISGFSDKAPLLLQEILKQLSLPPPTPRQFEQYVDHLSKELSNGSKDLAVVQAKELLASIIYLDHPTKKAELETLKSINYDDFCTFLHTLYDRTYVQAMFCGNLRIKDAESGWLDVRHLLGGAPFLKKDHPQTKILSLPDNQGPFAIHEKSDVLGHAAFLMLDQGTFNFEKRAVQDILGAVLKESFFDTLRSKQKTGYIAQANHQELELRLFQYFLVQSNSHQPEDLLSRFELFLETFLQDLPEMIPETRFSTLKQNLAESMLTSYRNLDEKSALWNLLAFDYGADFAWVEKRLSGFAQLNYETFLKETRQFLSRDNRKRLAILFEGRIDSPFTYENTTAKEIAQKSDYLMRSDLANFLEEPKKEYTQTH